MAVLLPLYLEAHNPEHNHYRAYDLTLAQDLLGDWVVVVCQGRCGQMVSASRAHVVDSLAAGQCLVQRLLHCRLSAPQRIGCAYQVVHGTAATTVTLSDWLPLDWPACEAESGATDD